MYTATSKQILGPVAEAISQLVVLNADAETHNTAIPDLTEVAQVVHAQAQNLVQVGESMMPAGDAELQLEMPVACAQVTTAANLLVEAARELKANGRAKPGRLKLIEGAKGILQGTARLLDVFDDSQVRAIVATCRTGAQMVDGVRRLGDDIAATVEHMRPTCQTLVDLTQLATRRVDEMLYAPLQERLRDAIDNITRTTALMITSTKAVAQNPTNSAALQARDFCCDRLMETIIDVEAVVQIREWSEPAYSELMGMLSSHRAGIHKHLIATMSTVQTGDSGGLRQCLDDSKATTAVIINQAKDILNYTRQEAKSELATLIDEISATEHKIEETSLRAIDNHYDAALQRELYTVLTTGGDQFRDLEGLTDHIVAADIREAISQACDHQKPDTVVGDLYLRAKTGDQEKFVPASEAFKKDNDRLTAVLNYAAMLSKNPEIFRNIQNGQADMSRLMDQVIASGSAVVSNPSDPYLNEHLEAVIKLWEDRLKKIETVVIGDENLFQTHDLLAADAVTAKTRFKTLLASLDASDDAVKINSLVVAVMQTVERALEGTRKEHEQSEDPEYRKKLRIQVDNLVNVLAQGRAIVAQPNKTPSVETLKKFQEAVMLAIGGAEGAVAERRVRANRSILTSIPEAITEYDDDEKTPVNAEKPEIKALVQSTEAIKLSTQELNVSFDEIGPDTPRSIITDANGEEVEVVNAKAPQPLPEEEAKQNPIKAAAQELKVTASQWSANPMVSMGSTLAENMSLISSLYRENTPEGRKQMLQLTKSIQDDCKFLVAEGLKVANACKDKTLKLQVTQALESIQTLTMQLKIVAAVKATEPNDRDSEKQLVAVSQNLMRAIQSALTATEVASIRVLRTAGNTAVAVVKFRKLLYSSKSQGQRKSLAPKPMATLLKPAPSPLKDAKTAPAPLMAAAARGFAKK